MSDPSSRPPIPAEHLPILKRVLDLLEEYVIEQGLVDSANEEEASLNPALTEGNADDKPASVAL
jgi:hypothetical protein